MSIKNLELDLNYIDTKKVPDGSGGFKTEYTIGEPFKALFRQQEAKEQALATQKGLNEVWILNADKKYPFEYNDFIIFEGRRFRIVSGGESVPNISSLADRRIYQAELVVI